MGDNVQPPNAVFIVHLRIEIHFLVFQAPFVRFQIAFTCTSAVCIQMCDKLNLRIILFFNISHYENEHCGRAC